MMKEKLSILFFGRNGCNRTQQAIKHLKILNYSVTSILSNKRGETIPKEAFEWAGEYIFCFRSLFILPLALINNATNAAINFHPGPPEYPGSGCINFALYDECHTYGVTAHIMNDKIDNGQILHIERFPILNSDSLDTLLEKTHSQLFTLFLHFTQAISKHGHAYIEKCINNSTGLHWATHARTIAELDQLQTIRPDIHETELKKIIRASYTQAYPPKISLHGYDFILSSPNQHTFRLMHPEVPNL